MTFMEKQEIELKSKIKSSRILKILAKHQTESISRFKGVSHDDKLKRIVNDQSRLLDWISATSLVIVEGWLATSIIDKLESEGDEFIINLKRIERESGKKLKYLQEYRLISQAHSGRS